MPIRVAIADDCRLSRESLGRVLATDPGLDVVADTNGLAVPSLSHDEHPDILLVDCRTHGSLDLCRRLSGNGARPWTIVLAAQTDEAWEVMALEAGVRGILARNACVDELTKAIHLVHAGEIWARKEVITRMTEELVAFAGADQHKRAELTQRLSPREQEVLRHAVEGLSNKEIADRLGASQATIKAHLTHIFQKLGVRDRVQLAAQYHGAIGSLGLPQKASV